MNDPLGHSLGHRLAEIQAAARVRAAAVTEPMVSAAKAKHLHSSMEHFEAEMAPGLAQMLGWLAEQPNLPDGLKYFVDQVGNPENQTDFFLSIAGLISFVLTSMFQLGEPYTKTLLNDLWAMQPVVPLAPGDAADAVVRGVWNADRAEHEAAMTGINAERLETIVKITGNPPGLAELMEALRRGIIDKERFEHGVRQSRYKDEWTDVIEALRFSPMSIADAVNAVVQSHITYDDGKAIATQDGLLPEHFETLVRVHGRPPGLGQLDEAYNRQYISDAEWEQGVKESDVKNKYIDPLRQMRRAIPPPRTIPTLLKHGVIDFPRAVRLLLDHGYIQEDAVALAESALYEKHQTEKDFTMSQVVAMFEDRAITEDDAKRHLSDLGYDATEVGLIIANAEIRHHARYTTALLQRFHTLYVGYRIAESELAAGMDSIQIPTDQKTELLRLWGLERQANAPDYTLSQLQHLLRIQYITPDEFTTAVLNRGWLPTDVDNLKGLAFPPSGAPQKGTI